MAEIEEVSNYYLNNNTCLLQCERNIKDYNVLIDYVTIYLAEICIPKFKREKELEYLKQLKRFCEKEVLNN